MNNEKLNLEYRLEQNGNREIERKFLLRSGNVLDRYKDTAVDITQLYLSSPEDEYSLRLRERVTPDGEVTYSATLKDRGHVGEQGLVRMEVETMISQECFWRYQASGEYATLHKKRAELGDGITVDWIDGSETPLVEVEGETVNQEASDFLHLYESELIERTGQPDVDNERLAYALSERLAETAERPATISPLEIIDDILAFRSTGVRQLVIGIAGRSGSGKTTMARELIELIAQHPELGEEAILVSTDDYHRGKQYLESTYGAPWENWEDARVYDTAELARDIKKLQAGQSVLKRRFDFASEETVFENELPPRDIILIEGLHSGSRDLALLRQMFYEVKTPLSTSLGRDMKRLLTSNRPNGSISSAEERLKYVVEIGEPTYQEIHGAPRNQFSGCLRKLGRTALS